MAFSEKLEFRRVSDQFVKIGLGLQLGRWTLPCWPIGEGQGLCQCPCSRDWILVVQMAGKDTFVSPSRLSTPRDDSNRCDERDSTGRSGRSHQSRAMVEAKRTMNPGLDGDRTSGSL